MTIHEPATLATDYLLCIAGVVFGARLWHTFRLWSLGFLGTAAGALLGGTYHGLSPEMTAFSAAILWKATIFSIALASFFVLAGCGRMFAVIAIVKLTVAMSWMIGHDSFLWVVADYSITFLIIGGVMIVAWFRERVPSAPWILGSISLSVVGAIVQQSRIAPNPNFNQNDLYHVIQIVALWALYRGGRLMALENQRFTTSSKDRPTSPPT